MQEPCTVSWGLRIPRFYPLLDTALLAVRGLTPVDAAEALIEAGTRILQLRHKGTYSRAMFDQASTIARMCRDTRTAFIVNDRADVALMVDAGVHVGRLVSQRTTKSSFEGL